MLEEDLQSSSSGGEGGTLGQFTLLFLTPEDMSPGMSHTRTSTRTDTLWRHLNQPG